MVPRIGPIPILPGMRTPNKLKHVRGIELSVTQVAEASITEEVLELAAAGNQAPVREIIVQQPAIPVHLELPQFVEDRCGGRKERPSN